MGFLSARSGVCEGRHLRKTGEDFCVIFALFGRRICYVENPVGIDVPSPRLSWKLPEGRVRQSAYELEIDGRTWGVIPTRCTGTI